jgi:hypothetical protein
VAYDLGVGVGHRSGDVEGGDGRGLDGERTEWRDGAGPECEANDGQVNRDLAGPFSDLRG